MSRFVTLPLVLALAAANAYARTPPEPVKVLSTVAERSGFKITGRYEEVINLCDAFQKAYPAQVRCVTFGTTPEKRPMKALVVTRTGAFTPEQAAKRNLPVVLIQGGIHAGEIDGKDAGFLALRQVLEGNAAPGALDKQVLVFVPVFNVDGHERFGRYNRPNQRGPEEMGWRVTSQNFNLNRDYVKADAPEMQAMLELANRWDPLASIDLHVTDGAQFEHDISIQVEPVHAGDDALKQAGSALQQGVIKDLAAQGSLPTPYYLSFADEDDPMSGFVDGVPPPRFSTGYFMLRNRFGMLVETHSWKDYPTRVRITRNTVVSVLEHIAKHGAQWRETVRAADKRAASLEGGPVPLTYKTTDKTRQVPLRGYEYTRTQSDVSGARMTRYDETKPKLMQVPLRDEIVADVVVPAPLGGYVVPAAHSAMVAAKLRQHGVAYTELKHAIAKAPLHTFRATDAKFGATSVEGHQTLTVQGGWKPESREIGAGSLFVPIAQPKARLVMAILEPQAPDSLLSWGAFNNAFERKEYMEDYVAEDVARQQMAADPALAAEFKKTVAEDAAFAKNPKERLNFFAKRHSSYDERLRLYPVMRSDSVLK